MPTYEYHCSGCGSFTALRPMAEYRDRQPCPQCAAPSPRITLTGPALSGSLFSAKGGGESSLQGCAHPGGCRCC